MVDRIRAKNIGPVGEADIRFGDPAIFVGPQATEKSIFLQVLKLPVNLDKGGKPPCPWPGAGTDRPERLCPCPSGAEQDLAEEREGWGARSWVRSISRP